MFTIQFVFCLCTSNIQLFLVSEMFPKFRMSQRSPVIILVQHMLALLQSFVTLYGKTLAFNEYCCCKTSMA